LGILAFAAVGGGAALGAWLRWVLGIALNPIFPAVPLGTLTANLCGGFLIGVAIHAFATYSSAPPEARLLVITGFLGGFTTFSTFSAEVVELLARKAYGWGALVIGAHVIGSLLLTVVGLWAARLIWGATQP
jgi:fluoride exporter